jgi:hypothetical protein
MKSDGVSKLYDRLSIEERFRLRIRALAPGDRADWERLDRTCPLLQYQAYCARLEASDVLTLCALVDILPKLVKLQMVGATRSLVEHLEGAGRDVAWLGYLDGYAAGWKAAGKRSDPPKIAEEDLTAVAERRYAVGTRFSETLGALGSTLAARARTPRDGLAAFAEQELGLTLDDLLGAWGKNALAQLAEHADALDAAEPDTDELALMGDVLRLAWRRHGLSDPSAEIDDELRARYESLERRAHDAVDD